LQATITCTFINFKKDVYAITPYETARDPIMLASYVLSVLIILRIPFYSIIISLIWFVVFAYMEILIFRHRSPDSLSITIALIIAVQIPLYCLIEEGYLPVRLCYFFLIPLT
jgi:hypothetical protein